MRVLLRIDASARSKDSYTRELSDTYQAHWQRCHPQGRIIRRDLAERPVPHLSQALIQAFHTPADSSTAMTALSDRLVDEVVSADDIVISSPLYNLSMPSTIKSYLDHVMRPGKTFQIVDGDYRRCLPSKRAVIITSRGSLTGGTQDDFQTAYLQTVLGVLGCDSPQVISVEGTGRKGDFARAQLRRCRDQIDALFPRLESVPEWVGAAE